MLFLEPAFEPTLTVGLAETTTRYDDGLKNDVKEGFLGGQRLSLDAGVKVTPEIAIVVHGAIAVTATTQAIVQYEYNLADPEEVSFPYTYRPYEVGIGAVYTLANRVWISPWLGVVGVHTKHSIGGYQPKELGVGGSIGVDLYASHLERVSLIVDATYSKLNDYAYAPDPEAPPTIDPMGHDASLAQLGVGVAYRHW